MRWALLMSILTWAPSSGAESGWLSTRGTLPRETRLEAFLGLNTGGAGFVRTDRGNERAGITAEASFAFAGRFLEFRGGRVWQLTEPRFATPSVTIGGAVFLVPDRAFDFGVGPNAQLALSLGGRRFSVDLALQTGAEAFARRFPDIRLPQRITIGLHLRLGDFTVALMARAGADLVPGSSFVGRGEVVVSVGWLGLDRVVASPTQ